ncbi:hypothetical protein [Haloprofundus sp. MHR1]|uniref:hypothetical protein n=1 Tax=Haloprofundus sp. MHR1 TaxID=2572921 RepID=UPI0010BF003E|nr:hypothetical protein [Haloprofundus sp. MHR1]QCJ46786.1 hypothetical protein FCF25_06540 [Haloprofundus sp. MHR1]
MGEKRTEACGRCSMSSVVSLTTEGRDEADGESRTPFSGARIELDDDELRRASPSAWFEGTRRRLDELATRLAYGER